MAVAPLLMIGGSALAGYLGSKLGKKKSSTPATPAPQQAADTSATAGAPATPTPAPQAQSEATAQATQVAQKQRRRAAAGSSGRTPSTASPSQAAITPMATPLMLIGGGS